jgi:hypothetical protein
MGIDFKLFFFSVAFRSFGASTDSESSMKNWEKTLVGGFNHLEKYESQWEGLYIHI